MTDTVLAVLDPGGPRLADPEGRLLRADDLGVLRGESVFETLRIAGGRPAFVEDHLARLARSAARLELALPAGWPDLVALAVGAWGRPDGVLRLVCSRAAWRTPSSPRCRPRRCAGGRGCAPSR